MDDSHVLLIEKDQNRAAGIAKELPDQAKLSVISDAGNALHILMRNTFDLIALNGLLNGVQGLFTYLYDLREAKTPCCSCTLSGTQMPGHISSSVLICALRRRTHGSVPRPLVPC